MSSIFKLLEFRLPSHQEILVRTRDQPDFLGFSREVTVPYLPFDLAKEFLREGASEWDPTHLERSVILSEMVNYLEFAWTKVQDHRGISAARSVEKIGAWLFLLGDSEAVKYVTDDHNYKNYGAPALMYVTRRYNAEVPDDKGVLRMTIGLPCTDDCDEGCA